MPEAPLTEVDGAARDEPTAGGDPGATAIPEGPGLPVTADDSAAQEAFGVSTSDRPDGADGDRRHRRPRRPDPWWRQVVEWVAVAAVALLIAVVLRTFVVQTFYVPSGSMLPTLQIGDRIIVNKLYGPIHRFDIIVFRRTPEDTSTTDADLVKRVIGLPGETIYVNGKAINESWLPTTTGSSCPQAAYDIQKTHIPANDYFVMGDCRGNSEDSRAWGFVPSTYIVGKVFVVVWRHGHPWLHWF